LLLLTPKKNKRREERVRRPRSASMGVGRRCSTWTRPAAPRLCARAAGLPGRGGARRATGCP